MTIPFQRAFRSSRRLAVSCMLILLTAMPNQAADPLERIAIIASKGKPGTLDHLFLDTHASRLFLTNQTNDTLDVIDLKNSMLLKQVPDQKSAHSVVYVPGLDRIFVGCGGGSCSVLDGTSLEPIKSIKVDGADSVRFDPRTECVAVASRKSLTLIDAKKLEITAQIELPGTPHGFQIAKGGETIYVNSEPPTQVAVVDAKKKLVVTKYVLAGDHKSVGPITLDEPSHRILVGLRAKPRLAVLDMVSGKEVAGVPIPEGADDMSFDRESNLIFVTSSAGFITVVRRNDADRYEHVVDLKTVKGAKTSVYDPALKRLYLGVPRQEGKDGPEIWVYQSRP